MRLKLLKPNQSILEVGQVEIFFSYDTPVAVDTGDELMVTNEKFSKTTSGHIRNYVGERVYLSVDQSQIESYLMPGKLMALDGSK